MAKAQRISPASLAQLINDDCENRRLFWACGLIRENLEVWKTPEHRALLSEDATVLLDAYLQEATVAR